MAAICPDSGRKSFIDISPCCLLSMVSIVDGKEKSQVIDLAFVCLGVADATGQYSSGNKRRDHPLAAALFARLEASKEV